MGLKDVDGNVLYANRVALAGRLHRLHRLSLTLQLCCLLLPVHHQGGGVRLSDGSSLLSDVTVNHCHGLSAGAGAYLEAATELDAHLERCVSEAVGAPCPSTPHDASER